MDRIPKNRLRLPLRARLSLAPEDRPLRVKTWAFTPAAWTPGLKLRLVVVADVHGAYPLMPPARIRRIVDQANGLGGDMILLLGDYRASHIVQSAAVTIEEMTPIFAGLRAPMGVWAVQGNHDWWDDARAQLRREGPTETERLFQAHGIPLLENRAVRLAQGNRPFWLAGLGSQWAFGPKRGGVKQGVDDLPGTLAQITDEAPVILMAHEPDIFAKKPPVSLVVSGHTHGGQIRLFGWTPHVPSAYGTRYAYGHVREEGRDLVVSAGVGNSGLPVRVGMPAEITVIELG